MPSYSRRVKIPGRSSQELYQVTSNDIDHFLSKAPMLGSYQVEPNPENKSLQVKSSMFSATLTCREEEIELSVQLSMLAAPFKSKLDEGISQWLAKKFDLKTLA
jgi:hypothetical protein